MTATLKTAAWVFLAAIAMVALAAPRQPASAADEVEMTIAIKDHKFDPPEVRVPAGKAIRLTVKNLDSTAEEFESKPLKVEKVIAGGGTAVFRLRAQTKGSYRFFGEYHESTAQGMLIVE